MSAQNKIRMESTQLIPGQINITRANGYSHLLSDGPLKDLVYSLDQWIEKNTGVDPVIKLSKKMHEDLSSSVGYPITSVASIVGVSKILVSGRLKKSIKVEPNGEVGP